MTKPLGPRRHGAYRVVKFCAHAGCRELVHGFVCGPHFRDLPLLLRRALTGADGAERHEAEEKVRAWWRGESPTQAPSTPPVRPFHERHEKEEP